MLCGFGASRSMVHPDRRWRVRPLIEATELAGALIPMVSAPVVLDVRWRLGGPSTYSEFLAGHVPGAYWVDLDADLADPPGSGGRHPLPDPGRLQSRLRSWGIDDDSHVVVYDDANATAAARAWWVLRWAGLDAVQVLHGGLAAWTDAGGDLRSGPVAPSPPGAVTVRPGAMPTLDADGAARLAAHGVLLDARAAPRYRGEVEPVDPIAGHIPGARSAPTTDNVDGTGRFVPVDQLQERFARLGVSDVAADPPVGVYCGSGVTAAHTVLALELAGRAGALYPGSWSEWVADPNRAVVVGPEP
jgi:thiosulfate/3-mercaptopyruvate sulfurtransferase